MPTEPREIVAEVELGVATAVPETDSSPDVALVKLKPVTRGMRTPATEPRVTVELVPVTVRFASAVTVGVFVADVKDVPAIVGARLGVTEFKVAVICKRRGTKWDRSKKHYLSFFLSSSSLIASINKGTSFSYQTLL